MTADRENPPIDSDSCRNLAKFELRDFPFEIIAKKFDGLAVGFRPSTKIFCADKSARYDALRGSSGSEGRLPMINFPFNSMA
jgi:hypothetical protein